MSENREGAKTDSTKRIGKVVQFSIVNISCGCLPRGESFSFVHTHLFVVFSPGFVFSALTFMRSLTTDQICDEYKSYKLRSG